MQWDEVNELIFTKPKKREMELPEDVVIYLSKKNIYLKELIDKFKLELIYYDPLEQICL